MAEEKQAKTFAAMKRLVRFGNHLLPGSIAKDPVKVTVHGATGNTGYILSFMIAQGRMFGRNQPVSLTLLDIPAKAKKI